MSSDNVTETNPLLEFINKSQGVISSSICEIILYPSWVIAIRKILTPYVPLTDMISEIYHSQGILGFYSGISVGVAYRSLSFFITKNIYDFIEKIPERNEEETPTDEDHKIKLKKAASAIIATGIASILTTPLQTIQNNLIANPKISLGDVCRHVTKDGNYVELFNGAIPSAFGSILRKIVYIFGTPIIGNLIGYTTKSEDSFFLNTLTLIGVTIVSTFLSSPFNFAITYLQSKKVFSNTLDCWMKASENGYSILWSGYLAQLAYESPRQLLIWYLNKSMSKLTSGKGYTKPV